MTICWNSGGSTLTGVSLIGRETSISSSSILAGEHSKGFMNHFFHSSSNRTSSLPTAKRCYAAEEPEHQIGLGLDDFIATQNVVL